LQWWVIYLNSRKIGVGGAPDVVLHEISMDLRPAPPFFWSRSMVELLKLELFGWKNSEHL
jgi:hypothetical protein